MSTPHKHAALIHAWADGAEIQARSVGSVTGTEYWSGLEEPNWSSSCQYRIKPHRWQAEIARQVAELEAASKPVAVVAAVEVAADAPDISHDELCYRLGFTVSGSRIESFGFEARYSPAWSCQMWREADFRPICAALVKHIHGVAA